MKWLIASDIHGSAHWCGKLMSAYEKERADRMLLLGDILYHGPRNDLPQGYSPKETAAMLNTIKNDILCVRGNCEAEVDQLMLEFPVMAEYAVICTETHPEKIIFATHGHKFNNDNLPPMHSGDILLHGHTHIPVCEKHDGYIYINPGSVSIPKLDTPHSYMLLDSGVFLWKTLDGDTYNEYSM